MISFLDFLKPVKARRELLKKEKREAYKRDNREFILESKRKSAQKARERKRAGKR